MKIYNIPNIYISNTEENSRTKRTEEITKDIIEENFLI